MTDRPRILIVDDLPQNVEVLGEYLAGTYDIQFACSGPEALALIRNAVPDLILLDVMMPEMDGYSVCAALRGNPATSDVPVIFVTARNDAASEAQALAAGGVDFIHKPVNAEVVRARVAVHLTLRNRERQLAALNAELEDRVDERTQALRDALMRAEAANRAKSTFLTNMSHEIRTPLNGIIGMAGLLRTKENEPDKLRRIDLLLASADTLHRVLANVLDMARFESGQLQLDVREFPALELRERLDAAFNKTAAAKGLGLQIDLQELPAHLRGDLENLTLLLSQIMDNAIKYSSEGSITVRGSVSSETDLRIQVAFAISDQGPGILAEDVERIFSAFELADNTATRTSGGTGLGLTIARHLAGLMGGNVRLEASSQEGSLFIAEVWLEKVSA